MIDFLRLPPKAGFADPAPEDAMPSAPRPSALLLRRLGAIVYDTLICAGLVMGIGLAFTLVMGGTTEGMRGPGPVGRSLLQAAALGVPAAYFLISWILGGQTVGMRPWRLRVVAADGGPVAPRAAAIRLAAALVSGLPAGLGFLWSLIARDRLAWHDRLSRTRLVRLARRDSAQAQEH